MCVFGGFETLYVYRAKYKYKNPISNIELLNVATAEASSFISSFRLLQSSCLRAHHKSQIYHIVSYFEIA